MTTKTSKEILDKRARLSALIPEGEPDASTEGVNHLAIFAKDLEATAAFYTDVLGMPVVRVTPNRCLGRRS